MLYKRSLLTGALLALASIHVCCADTLFSPPPAEQDASLMIFAVHIERTPKQSWPGYGIYLGNGYVLTAAHVVGRALFSQPRVEINGETLPTKVVREGSFQGDDLTFLRIDDNRLPVALRLRHVTLCSREPPLGSSVIVVTPEGTARSKLVFPKTISASVLSRFPTLIGDVASTGNSGSGVFNAKSQCLLGIMSRKISFVGHIFKDGHKIPETLDVAKYFVPSSIIAKALPPHVQF